MDALGDAEFEAWLAAQATEHLTREAEGLRITESDGDTEEVDMEAAVAPPVATAPRRARKKARVEARHDPVPINLLPSQIAHRARLMEILDRNPYALDFSMLGAGKTYTAARVALDRAFAHILVICPVSVIPKWSFMRDTHGLPVRDIMGFQKLRSAKFRQPAHGLLARRDYKTTILEGRWQTPVEIDKVEFKATDKLRQWIAEGLLVVVDELQNVKNISAQFHAVSAIIHAVIDSGSNSRVLALSGSPIDKQEHALHLFRALGVMRADRVAQYNIQTGQMMWEGIQEIVDACRLLDPQRFAATPPRGNFEDFDKYAYRLFQSVFKHRVSSCMTTPVMTTALAKHNAFYNIDAAGAEIVARGVAMLRSAARFDGTTVNFTGGGAGQMAGVTRALQVVETGKIGLMTRIAKSELGSNPSLKLCIAVNYSDTVSDLVSALSAFNPLVLTGSTSVPRRDAVLRDFQAPDGRHRLLIANQSVISTGVDLDDKHGAWPRLCLVSPNYSTITSYQLGHRFRRADTRSDARVRFVYAKRAGQPRGACEDILELRVLHALGRKSAVMKETTSEQVAAGVVFPGDHPEWSED